MSPRRFYGSSVAPGALPVQPTGVWCLRSRASFPTSSGPRPRRSWVTSTSAAGPRGEEQGRGSQRAPGWEAAMGVPWRCGRPRRTTCLPMGQCPLRHEQRSACGSPCCGWAAGCRCRQCRRARSHHPAQAQGERGRDVAAGHPLDLCLDPDAPHSARLAGRGRRAAGGGLQRQEGHAARHVRGGWVGAWQAGSSGSPPTHPRTRRCTLPSAATP